MTQTLAAEPLTKAQKRYQVIRQRIDDGLCRDCAQKRGKDGTADRCRPCADAQNLYHQRRWAERRDTVAQPSRSKGAVGSTISRIAPVFPKDDQAAAEYVTPQGRRLTLRLSKLKKGDPNWPDANTYRGHLFAVKGKGKERSINLTFSAGTMFDGPDIRLVLWTLALDARDDADDFETYCATHRMSRDSMRARKLYNQMIRQSAGLRDLLGNEADAVLDAFVKLTTKEN